MSKPASPSQVALFTDFGCQGPYLGQMESVLYAAGIRQPVIRLLSDAPLFNPRAAAYLLAALASRMPAQTLFLSIVDPGVGGERLPLLVRWHGQWFVGPDNGLFSRLQAKDETTDASVIEWTPERLSASFHGRDLFAPIAANICRGESVAGRALARDDMVGADWPSDLAEVIYIDHYGNLFTGIKAESLEPGAVINVGKHRITHARTFSESAPNTPFWYENSIGLVELAVNQGRAERHLGLKIGDRLSID